MLKQVKASHKTSSKKGFTLLEILLVIGIISVLAGITLVAINPSRQIAAANNAKRQANAKAILDAVQLYMLDNGGYLPGDIPMDSLEYIGDNPLVEANICASIVPNYLPALPVDPTATNATFNDCTNYYLGYSISRDNVGRVTVTAPFAQLSEVISITR